MSLTATAVRPQAKAIPPDLAAILGDAPIHPELQVRAPSRPAPPTAAVLTQAALALAACAAMDLGSADLGTPPRIPAGATGYIHAVSKGGVLHLEPSSVPRAVSIVRGTLAQRCVRRPSLSPGVVRLIPAGHALTLTELAGEGALAVEVVF
jgi:hypothetical protein